MTASLLADQARTARHAGLTTLLELQVLSIIAHRGEATLISLSNSTRLSVEMIAHTCTALVGRRLIRAHVCQKDIGYTVASLLPAGEAAAKAILDAGTPALLSKNLTPARP